MTLADKMQLVVLVRIVLGMFGLCVHSLKYT
jgi:hypothetical protein